MVEVAEHLGRALGKPWIEPAVSGRFRVGDIRHCFADIDKARTLLGYRPQVSLDAGLVELAEWLDGRIAIDRVEQASRELALRGLTA